MLDMTASWQDITAIAVGVLAVAHLAWRWWPRAADQAPASGVCGHCDQGCKAACPTETLSETPIRVIPSPPKP
ncbi:MAG TPA: hypothetical protein PLS22_01195 [Aquabacterium sp.]|nr:hypothetical protein [Aquabacterium sp.]